MTLKFSQGNLPSCQTLAALGALSTNPRGLKHLEQIAFKTADNTYEVRFPTLPDHTIIVSPDEYECTIQSETYTSRAIDALTSEFGADHYFWLAFPDRLPHVSGDELARVLEIAYAKYQKIAHPTCYANVPDRSPLWIYRHPDFHYQADESLRDISGWKVATLAAGDSTTDGSASFAERRDVIPHVLGKLAQLADGVDYVATACTVGVSGSHAFLDPGGKIIPWHDYIVAEVSMSKRTIHLIDPFNSRITLILSHDDFFEYFYLIALVTIPESLTP